MTWIMEEIIILPFSFHCVLNYPVSALSLLISKAPVFSISPLRLFIFILLSYPNATMMWPLTRCSQGHGNGIFLYIWHISSSRRPKTRTSEEALMHLPQYPFLYRRTIRDPHFNLTETMPRSPETDRNYTSHWYWRYYCDVLQRALHLCRRRIFHFANFSAASLKVSW